jgi:hypothetical protein
VSQSSKLLQPSNSYTDTDQGRLNELIVPISLPQFMATMDVSMVSVAMNSITRGFDPPFATIQWASLGFMLSIARE